MSKFRAAFLVFAQAFLLVLPQALPVEARPVRSQRFEAGGGSVVWHRLSNEEVQVDFSPENLCRIDSFMLTEKATDLAGIVGEGPVFWEDRINGEEVFSASAKLLAPKRSDESAALLLTGYPVGDDATKIAFTKDVRLFPEGAQLEVRYRLENTSGETLPVSYSVALAWKVATTSNDARFYLPSSGSIRKIVSEETATGVAVEGLEIPEPWFSATSPESDLSCLFVSDRPLVSWSGNQDAAGGGAVAETVVWEGSLKPSEKVEGTCWVAAVSGLGTPVSVSGHYAVGTVWKPGTRPESYCLETRLVGMPKGLKKLRLFSGVRRSSSSVAMVPVYTRRSRLSPTVVHSIAMPGIYEEGTHYLEQSIYSSSQNLGYWNVGLSTPGEAAAQVSSTPSGPVTNLSYYLPPEENPTPTLEPALHSAPVEDYASMLPQLSPIREEPEDPSADEIALLEWPNWEGETDWVPVGLEGRAE